MKVAANYKGNAKALHWKKELALFFDVDEEIEIVGIDLKNTIPWILVG